MSLYKELRYKEGDVRDRSLSWSKVDGWFREAIDLYNDIPANKSLKEKKGTVK